VKIVHNVQQVDKIEDMGRSMPRIYAFLNNKKDGFQFHMIEVEGNINDQSIDILIDSGISHSYIDHNLVEIFHLQISNLWKSWLVQLGRGAKRRINEFVKDRSMDMNGVSTEED
jgi:hypothetical protein